MTCSSPMTLRDFSHAQPLYSRAVQGNYPATILLSSSSTFTSRRSLSASIVLQIISRISDAATLHFIIHWTNLAGAALQYLMTGALLCVQDLVVTSSKLMGFHMYWTCGDQPPQGCGGIQFVLANFAIVALLSFVRW
ncbi:hypothetical protein B0H14DRAFT_2987845 [Mycena olivaceomarginata]|nr:hypothetical protein B0H14DRAFT_2987845 [Mycena olivaceomarginata]